MTAFGFIMAEVELHLNQSLFQLGKTPYNLYPINLKTKEKRFVKLEKILCFRNFPMRRYILWNILPLNLLNYYYYYYYFFCPGSFGDHQLGQLIHRPVCVLRNSLRLSKTVCIERIPIIYFTRSLKQWTVLVIKGRNLFYNSSPLARSSVVGMTSIAVFMHSALIRPLFPRVSIKGSYIFLLWELYLSLIVHRTTAMQTPRGLQ